MQGSARKDVVFGAAGVYPVTVPGPKWKSWLDLYARRGLLKGEQLHVGETWRSGLSSTKPNFLPSPSSRPAHLSKHPG